MTRPVPAATWAVVVVLQLVGAAAFLPSFRGWLVAPVVVLAVLLPVLLTALGRRLGVSAPVVVVATTSLGLVVATALTRGAAAPGASVTLTAPWRTTPFGEVVGPVVDAVARVATGPRPVHDDPASLAPVGLLVLLVSLAAALTVGRLGSATPGLVAGLATYTSAQLLAAGQADPTGLIAATLVAVACFAWAVADADDGLRQERTADRRGRPGRSRTSWTGGRRGLAIMAGAVALVVGLSVVPLGRPYEPRDHLPLPVTTVELGHPLAQVPVWQAQGDVELFRVGGALPSRLRLVALVGYDGVTWTPGQALRPLGSRTTESGALPPGTTRGRMTADVRLTGLLAAPDGAGDWVPSAGEVVEVSAPVLVDAATSSLLRPSRGPVDAGGSPTAYRVVADVDVPSEARLRSAGVLPGDLAGAHLDVPRLPEDLRATAEAVTADATTRWEQVEAIADAVTGDRTLAPDAPGGSSYARLSEFLVAPEEDGGQVGTEEQVASSFAVLARAVGIPTRVVVGFRLPEADREGVVVVRGRHASVWPEVHLVGAGWVPVDVGGLTAGTAARPGTPEEVERVEGTEQRTAAEEPVEPVLGDGETTAFELGDVLRGLGLGAAALGVLGVLGLVLVRLARRARLRRHGARGAWHHLEDVLVLAGAPPRPGESSVDLAARVGRDLPDPAAVLDVAAAAERAAYAPGAAAGGRDRATWRAAVRTERQLRRRAPVGRRVTWWVHPAPVLRSRPGRGPSAPRRRGRGRSTRVRT